jgi:site-specific recombinase XerD
MWKHQKTPHPSVLARCAKQITKPLKKFQTWELADRFKEWLRVLQYSRTAQDSYSRAVSKFCVYIGNKPLPSVTHLDVRDFLIDVTRRDISVQCVNRFLGGLRAFFDFLYLGGVVDSVAPRFIRSRRYVPPMPRALGEKKIRRLIAAADSMRDRAIFEVMYATGCRAGEIVGMNIEDIDFSQRTILVRGKGGERRVFFGKPALRVLRSYLRTRKKGVVFLTENPVQRGSVGCDGRQWNGYWRDYTDGRDLVRTRVKYLGPAELSRAQAWKRFRSLVPNPNKGQKDCKVPITNYVIYRLFQQASHRAGLGRVTSHQVRHSFATHLLDHGANVRQVQHLLGHSSLNSTQAYTRVSSIDIAEAYKKFHPRS